MLRSQMSPLSLPAERPDHLATEAAGRKVPNPADLAAGQGTASQGDGRKRVPEKRPQMCPSLTSAAF